MKLTKEKIDAINKTYEHDREGCHAKNIGITIKYDETFERIGVYRKNSHICDVEDIPSLIKELQRVAACVQFETGVMI